MVEFPAKNVFTHIVLSTNNPINEDAVSRSADRKDEEAPGSRGIGGPRADGGVGPGAGGSREPI